MDSWLVADKYIVKPGGEAWVAFVTGDVFPIGDGIVDPTRIDGLVDLHGTGREPIEGLRVEDDAVAVRHEFADAGFHLLGLSLKPRVIALEGDVFDHYLNDERANEAIARRQQSGNRGPVRERYTKFAKTIIEVGAAADDDTYFKKPLGQRLEIVPQTNPTRWQTGETVEVAVLLDGYPWPNVPVLASHEGTLDGEIAFRDRTDKNGIAKLKLTQSGQWYIRAHFIRPVSGLVNYEWESFWSTFTFNAKGKADVSGSLQLLKAIHGDVNPWAVSGFLIGERAMIDLNLAFGSDRLLAIHYCPQKLPYTAMLDGIQAATGATVGKLNLRMIPSTEDELRCEFFDMDSGKGLTVKLTPSMFSRMREVEERDAKALAVQMMTLPEDDIFISPEKKKIDETTVESKQGGRELHIETVKSQAALDKPLDVLKTDQEKERTIVTSVGPIEGQSSTGVFVGKIEEERKVGPGEAIWQICHGEPNLNREKSPFPLEDSKAEVRVTSR